MFENFTFGAQSQFLHDDISASPTDISFPNPPTSFPFFDKRSEELDDIVERFSAQTLERQQDFNAWGTSMQMPLEEDKETLHLPPISCAATRSFHTSKNSIACRRTQRQRNTQLQLTSSHIRDINTLIEDMITSSSQCTLQRRSPVTPPLSPSRLSVSSSDEDYSLHIDEGFSEPADFAEFEDLSLRRISCPSGIRKYAGIQYGRSGDVICSNGRQKVQSKPRMRKRPRQRKRQDGKECI